MNPIVDIINAFFDVFRSVAQKITSLENRKKHLMERHKQLEKKLPTNTGEQKIKRSKALHESMTEIRNIEEQIRILKREET